MISEEGWGEMYCEIYVRGLQIGLEKKKKGL